MAKILCIDTASNALDWLMRCQDAGHEVMWFDRNRKDGSKRMAGAGLVPKFNDLDALRKKWLGWADLIYLPDNVAYIELLEPYRKMGYPISGPGVEAAGVHPHQPPTPLLRDHAWRDREEGGGQVSEGVRDGPPGRAPETDEHREV